MTKTVTNWPTVDFHFKFSSSRFLFCNRGSTHSTTFWVRPVIAHSRSTATTYYCCQSSSSIRAIVFASQPTYWTCLLAGWLLAERVLQPAIFLKRLPVYEQRCRLEWQGQRTTAACSPWRQPPIRPKIEAAAAAGEALEEEVDSRARCPSRPILVSRYRYCKRRFRRPGDWGGPTRPSRCRRPTRRSNRDGMSSRPKPPPLERTTKRRQIGAQAWTERCRCRSISGKRNVSSRRCRSRRRKARRRRDCEKFRRPRGC